MSLPTLNSKRVIVENPMWIYAIWLNKTDLFVYRSPLVRDSHEWFDPIREELTKPHHVLSTEVIEDEGMVQGKANLTIYRMEGCT